MTGRHEPPTGEGPRVRGSRGDPQGSEERLAEQPLQSDSGWRDDGLLQAPGIIEGLDVSLTQDVTGTARLQVSPGMAVDSRGRTLVQYQARALDIDPAWTGGHWVAICVDERRGGPATGERGPTPRATQPPLIEVVPDLGALREEGLAPVPLARVQFTAGARPVLARQRIFAGLRLPGPGQGSTLQMRDGEPPENGGPAVLAVLDTALEVHTALEVRGATSEATASPLRVTNASGAPVLEARNDGAVLLNGNVGIGVAEPWEKLEVGGSVRFHGSRLRNASGFSIAQTDANDWLRINPDFEYPATALHGPVAIGGGGLAVGEWTQPPNGRLVVTEHAFVQGTIHEAGVPLGNKYAPVQHRHDALVSANGAYKVYMQDDRNFVLYAGMQPVWDTGTWVSDATLKRDVEPIHGAMEKLRHLRGVSFHWRDDALGTRRELGVLAQEVQPVLPELVRTVGGQHLGVHYERFVPVLIQALREQDERIARLEARLRDLGATA